MTNPGSATAASLNLLLVAEDEIRTPCSTCISAFISVAVLNRSALLFLTLSLSSLVVFFLFRPAILRSLTQPVSHCFFKMSLTLLWLHPTRRATALCEYPSSDKANTFPRFSRLIVGFRPTFFARHLILLLHHLVTVISPNFHNIHSLLSMS